ncbi:MAG: hypothetical protein KJO07_17570, partial [Deltaproteobacteria bacterium]|nr:hypothetical protein [Deltaproteobacteria bacterium]
GSNLVASGLGAMNSANLAVGGGDASTTGGTGGNAGNVVFSGFSSGASSSATEVDIAGGTGATAGDDGAYVVGGVDLSGSVLP